jgi:hypothetical protein
MIVENVESPSVDDRDRRGLRGAGSERGVRWIAVLRGAVARKSATPITTSPTMAGIRSSGGTTGVTTRATCGRLTASFCCSAMIFRRSFAAQPFTTCCWGAEPARLLFSS